MDERNKITYESAFVFRLHQELKDRAAKYALSQKRLPGEVMRFALEEYLERMEKKTRVNK